MATFWVIPGKAKPLKTLLVAISLILICRAPVLADSMRIWPNSNIRLTIVQWMPTKGAYEKWDALSGEFEVSENGELSLPVIGRLAVANLDETDLAKKIAQELKDKIGLMNAPEATVTVIKAPPIYVVGDVKTPGTYQYQTRMTALQALAMGGGEYRPDRDGSTAIDKTDLVTQLRGLENSILRGQIRIARLRVELSGSPNPQFDRPKAVETEEAEAIYAQEKDILSARANLLERQAKSFNELRDLLKAEILTLDKKAEGTDADIASVAKELRNIKSMVDKGIVLPAKQGDLERTLRSYSAARLDITTAAMRARQGITEASRNLEGLYDRQRTEVTADLQAEQANLDQLLLKQEASQKQLLKALSNDETARDSDGQLALTFSIRRRSDGVAQELVASDDTVLQPGDVLRVTRKMNPVDRDSKSVEQTLLEATPSGSSQ